MDSVATPLPLSGGYLLHALGIVLVNIALSGDIAMVTAMAVHGLPGRMRLRGILLGAIGAVLLRVFFTLAASHLLDIPFLKLIGGVIILWIAIKLLLEDKDFQEGRPPPASTWHAVRIILAADLTLSFENVLAVAGASRGDPLQIWLSLGLSIPLVAFASALLSRLMQRFPFIVIAGAALLGKAGGEMIVTDPGLNGWFRLGDSASIRWGAQTAAVLGVLAAAWRIRRRLKRSGAEEAGGPSPLGPGEGGRPREGSGREPPAP